MSGFFGITSKQECLMDVFFGVDFHSHLGTRRAGLAAYDKELGLQRKIHNIQNSPFRTKFERIAEEMRGTSAIGCISDMDPQPLLIRSKLGNYAICVVGALNNVEELLEKFYSTGGGHFCTMNGCAINQTELIASMINQKDSFVEGIRFTQDIVKGSASILILKEDGSIIASRDKLGRTPVLIGKREDGYAVSFEGFAYKKLDFEDEKELGPAEIVEITPNGYTVLSEPKKEMRICAFLWTYYGYSPSNYEGVNVEEMRVRDGAILARNDAESGKKLQLDFVGGMPDSGTPHAIGYANASKVPFARPYIKYTPTWARSFLPQSQVDRNKTAKMKQIPIHEFIKDKNLLFVDDSIVRGTQLKETVDFLYSHGAKAVHMRSACPPIMYGCKYLNFSRSTSDMDLLARKVIIELEGEEGLNYIEEYSDGNTERGKKLRKAICDKFHFASLEYQTLEGMIEAIGLEPCKLCTYCWTGKE